jgi:excinuclease UvrABC helicase subunit UvrB
LVIKRKKQKLISHKELAKKIKKVQKKLEKKASEMNFEKSSSALGH